MDYAGVGEASEFDCRRISSALDPERKVVLLPLDLYSPSIVQIDIIIIREKQKHEAFL